MIYVAIARYTRDAELLAAVRPAHRAHAQALRRAGWLLMGGPYADDTGALLVYRAQSLAEVHELIARDPYQQRGVFVGVEVKTWTVLGADIAALEQLVS